MEKELVVSAKLEEINSISRRLIVEVPADMVTKSVRSALAALKKDANVPGFRPGKAPDEIIKQRLGDSYNEEVLKQVVRDSYPHAVAFAGARPLSDPRIEAAGITVEEGKPLTYRAVFEVYPKVDPAAYEGINLTREKVDVSDDEVERELKILQRQMTQLEPAPDAVIENGILARIDFSGSADGNAFEGSEAKDFVIDIESESILSAFEKGVRGMKQGEVRDIEFDYPNDYFNKEIAGKHGRFHIEVKELRRKIVPALDDSFAKDLGNFTSLDEVRKVVRERIGEVKEQYQRSMLTRQAMEELAKKQPIDVPDAMVSRELGHMLEDMAHELEAQGKTLKEAGIEAQSFVQEHLGEAKLRVRCAILARAIAEKEGIAVTDDDISARIAAIAAHTGKKEAEVRAHFEKNNLFEDLKDQMLIDKAMELVVAKGQIKETSPKHKKG